MTNGRQKGSVAEREVAALIEAWWSQLEPGKFVRTPLSGGWGSPELRGEFKAAGDLMTTAPRFPFSVEVKRRESWAWSTFVAGRPSPVWGWWLQACTAAAEMSAMPMVWLRRSREPWLVMIPRRRSALRGIDLLEPDLLWTERQLPSSRVGAVHPVAILAPRILATDPALFLRYRG